MLEKDGGAEEVSRTRVRCAWSEFKKLATILILTTRGASLRIKGKMYKACVQSVLMYGGA